MKCADWIEMIQTRKGSKERLFIMSCTHSMQTFGEIPFVFVASSHSVSDFWVDSGVALVK